VHVNRRLNAALAAALLLTAGHSWALGLGRIEVKSRRNEPLLAEIPIISTTPGELAALQARLASPETFRRVGLNPPAGIAADLQFSLGRDDKGRPVIRVTTLRPVEQPVVNFLIEVDWGNGRLVREYSALIDVPNTAEAVAAAPMQLPQPAEDNRVQRPVAAAEAAPAPVVAPEPTPAPASVPDAAPAAPPPAIIPEPLPPALPSRSASGLAGGEYGPVKAGESLIRIASRLGLREAGSLDQALLALLRANPEAFIQGDVNRLRRGAVLRIPSREDVAAVDAGEAAQIIGRQLQQWTQARQVVAQPQDAEAGTGKDAAQAQAARAATPVAATARSEPGGRGEARLKILPPVAPGQAKGIQTGTGAGGEGSMLQQALRQRDEEIAAKNAEITELKERVAALEKIKDDQQKLIAMKDSELAAAQARLAATSKAATAQQPAAPPAPPAENSRHGASSYLWGGLGVVVLALLAGWLVWRRKPSPPPKRRVFDIADLAASMPAPAGQRQAATGAPPDTDPGQAVTDTSKQASAVEPAEQALSKGGDAAPAQPAETSKKTPQWHSGWTKVEVISSAKAPSASAESNSAMADVAAKPATTTPPANEIPAHATPEQRFKLVRAYLDMGDEQSAQQLLLELLEHEDDAVSDEAARMLSRLVG
jgi:pilus assembly protein FimV